MLSSNKHFLWEKILTMHAYLLPLELEERKVEKKTKDGTIISVTIWSPRRDNKVKRSPPSLLETLVRCCRYRSAPGAAPAAAHPETKTEKWTLKGKEALKRAPL
jgi:hypothetical protein